MHLHLDSASTPVLGISSLALTYLGPSVLLPLPGKITTMKDLVKLPYNTKTISFSICATIGVTCLGQKRQVWSWGLMEILCSSLLTIEHLHGILTMYAWKLNNQGSFRCRLLGFLNQTRWDLIKIEQKIHNVLYYYGFEFSPALHLAAEIGIPPP